MILRPIHPTDAPEWLRLRLALWPDTDPAAETAEIAAFFATDPPTPLPTLHAAFVCERPGGGLCGLVEVSIHDSAPGCATNRVGYLEAWYVDPDHRGQGTGRALVERAERWARAQGCREMASDTTPNYPLSPAAHRALGYKEAVRQHVDGVLEYYFRKAL